MSLRPAKDGGEAVEVPAQKVVRSPVLNIAPRKLNGKMKYSVLFFLFESIQAIKKVFKIGRFLGDFFIFIKTFLWVHAVAKCSQGTIRVSYKGILNCF